MSNFDTLIHNLKKDLQTLPSLEDASKLSEIKVCKPVVPEEIAIETTSMSSDEGSHQHHPGGMKSKYIYLFMKHGLLSTEFFIFFLILLSIVRPPFIYYNEKIYRNRREFIRTRFSFLYLFVYSGLFTIMIHIMMLLQKHLEKQRW